MTPATNIFVGSSQVAKQFAAHIAECLTEEAARVKFPLRARPWMEVFKDRNSQAFIDTVDQQLHCNDYFVMLLTPDAEVAKPSGRSIMRVGSENVLLEIGAVIGRHGMDRLFFVWDKKAHAPTDLGLDGRGAKLFQSTAAEPVWKAELRKVATEIVGTIRTKSSERHVNDGRTRYLSLIKCAPGHQRKVIEVIKGFEKPAREDSLVHYEQYGVVWGPPDNYLLFSAPGQRYFENFVEALRKAFKKTIRQIDTRTVFTKRYWRESAVSQSGNVRHLVLLSCDPSHVESAYGLIVRAAEEGLAEKWGVRVTNAGVMMGSDDVFLITETKSVSKHQKFIEDYLQPRLTDNDWLVENTTSLMTTA